MDEDVLGALARIEGAAVFEARGGGYSLQIREHARATVSFEGEFAASHASALMEALQPTVSARLAAVSQLVRAERRLSVEIETDSFIGFRSFTLKGGTKVLFRVRPKIDEVQAFELAVLAGLLPAWNGAANSWLGHVRDGDLLEWVAEAFLQHSLDLLRRGGLRSMHDEDAQILRNRVRGRVLVGAYIRQVMSARPNHVPCEFPVLKMDNVINQYLLWAIHLMSEALQETSSLSVRRAELAERYLKLLTRFHGVSLKRPVRTAREVSLLPRNMHHYRDAMRLARYVVDGFMLDATPGEEATPSVRFDMDACFERAFYLQALAKQRDAQQKPQWRVPIKYAGKKTAALATFIPDVFIPSSNKAAAIVVDTKWKDVMSANARAQDEDTIVLGTSFRLRNQDLYQISSYASEYRRRLPGAPVVAALVYPALGDTKPVFLERPADGVGERVCLVGWDVATDCRAGFTRLWEELSSIAEQTLGDFGSHLKSS